MRVESINQKELMTTSPQSLGTADEVLRQAFGGVGLLVGNDSNPSNAHPPTSSEFELTLRARTNPGQLHGDRRQSWRRVTTRNLIVSVTKLQIELPCQPKVLSLPTRAPSHLFEQSSSG